MIETSTDIAKLAAALHKAQAVMGGAVKDAKNPAFKSKYATLENVIDAAKPALNEAGVFFTQAPGSVSETLLDVTTMLIHAESGQWMRSTVQVPLPKRDPQGLGSAITYARRYALMSVLGMPAEDDDGNAASGPTQRQEKPYSDHPHAPANADAVAYMARCRSTIQAHSDRDELRAWWNSPTEKEARRAAGLTAAQVDQCKTLVLMRSDELEKATRPLAVTEEEIPF